MYHYCGNKCKRIVAETSERPFSLRFMRFSTRNSHIGGGSSDISTIVILCCSIVPCCCFTSQGSGLSSFRVAPLARQPLIRFEGMKNLSSCLTRGRSNCLGRKSSRGSSTPPLTPRGVPLMAPRGFRQRDIASGISPCSANHLLLIASLACGGIAILYQPFPLPARSHALHSERPFFTRNLAIANLRLHCLSR